MSGGKNIRVSGDEEGRCLDPCDLLREIEVLLHGLTDLAEESGPVLGTRCDAGVKLIHRRLLHRLRRLRRYLRLLTKYVWVESVAPEWSGDEHELAHHVRVSDGSQERDTTAQREPHDVGLLKLEMPYQGCDVVRHQIDRERTIDVGSPSVALQIDGDYFPALAKR